MKHPLVRGRLLKLWRDARAIRTPVAAWASIVEDPAKRASYTSKRGLGGFVRATWDEVNEIIAAANAYTVKTYGPDRVIGFSPIPAMSMVSYAAGSRYLSLLGGVCMSFYDWYCDLPPASPMTWGEQTDVPESADWYNAGFLMLWGSNVPQTRTPDAHFYTEVRYKGTKSVVVSPDYAEATKFADLWLHPKQGTDAALALAMGHVILREFHLNRSVPYFADYVRRYTDLPMLVRLVRQGEHYVPERLLRAADFADALGETNNPDWKTVAFDDDGNPRGAARFDRLPLGRARQVEPARMQASARHLTLRWRRTPPRSGGVSVFRRQGAARLSPRPTIRTSLIRNVPVRRLAAEGRRDAGRHRVRPARAPTTGSIAPRRLQCRLTTVCTPAWAERVTGVPREQIIHVARMFASNAEKTNGRSMVILGAGLNHWYHMDMAYRGIINLLVLCGCIGQSGGGWSHYVGQEKLRPQTGWLPVAFALDWNRPPRQQNSTSFFYAHTDQWRYETLNVGGDPVADGTDGRLERFADRLQRAGGTHGLAAVGAAVEAEPADDCSAGEGGRAWR